MSAPNICELVGRDKHHLVQLCLPIERVNGKLKFPMLASEKLDGVFCLAVVLDGKCYIYSRTGEEYLSLNHLKDGFCYLARISQLEVFIFEAYDLVFLNQLSVVSVGILKVNIYLLMLTFTML